MTPNIVTNFNSFKFPNIPWIRSINQTQIRKLTFYNFHHYTHHTCHSKCIYYKKTLTFLKSIFRFFSNLQELIKVNDFLSYKYIL